MLKYYQIGIVSTYEIVELIQAKSLKKAMEIAKERYYEGCYMADDEEAVYRSPKFYDRYFINKEFKKENK